MDSGKNMEEDKKELESDYEKLVTASSHVV